MIPYGKQEKKEVAVDLIGGSGFVSGSSGVVDETAQEYDTHGKPWQSGAVPSV